MGRRELHTTDVILDAARSLVLEGGARSATVAAIAGTSGAPKGSIYHRFQSLDDLLTDMWLRAVRRSQAVFLDALDDPDPVQAALAAALALHDFAVREPDDARLLASLRRQDLIEMGDPKRRRELEVLNEPLARAIGELARRLYGRSAPSHIEKTMFAVIDLPIGAIRRHLNGGTPLPRTLRPQLAAAVRAALPEGRSSTA